MLPMKGDIFIGSGDFKEQGIRQLDHLIEYCHLHPDHRVLDVGCGIGRTAIALTDYLSSSGSYEGFDIVPKGIDWCQKHIAAKYPTFNSG